jgi:hypothetical protein
LRALLLGFWKEFCILDYFDVKIAKKRVSLLIIMKRILAFGKNPLGGWIKPALQGIFKGKWSEPAPEK